MAKTSRRIRFWSVLNWVGFLVLIVINALGDSLPIGGMTSEQVAARHPNLFSPAGFTFAIWAVIFGLLALFCLFQISDYAANEHSGVLVRRIGPYFFVAALLNASWVMAWHREQIALCVALMTVTLLALAEAYRQIGDRAVTAREKWMVRVPVSVYLAWVTVVLVANIASLVADVNPDFLGLGQQGWTVLLVLAVAAVGLGVLFAKRDIAFGAVIVWALAGIWVKHVGLYDAQYRVVLIASAILALMLAVDAGVVLARGLIEKHKELRSAQTQP